MDHGHGHGLAPKTNSIAQGQRLFRHQSVENGKLCLLLYLCIRLGSVLFCSVLCSVLCLLFTRQFGKENRNAFIYSWTTCHAGMSSSKAARQTDLHWVPWTFWIIDHNIHSKQTDRQTDIHVYMYLSTSDLRQELVKILSDLCWLTSLRTKWKHTFPKTHFSPMWPQIKKLLNINYKFQYHSIWQLSLSSTRDTNVHPR